MTIRILVSWLVLLVVAVANGAFREALLVPRLGPAFAHVASTAMLGTAILIASWFLVPWIRPDSVRDVVAVGMAWLILTLLFEFGFGRARGMAWSQLLADYDLRRGRIWVLVPIVTALAPWIVARVRGLLAPGG